MKITDFIYTPPSSATESIQLDKLAHMNEQSRFLDDYERNSSEGRHEQGSGRDRDRDRDGDRRLVSEDSDLDFDLDLDSNSSQQTPASLDHRPAKNTVVRWLHTIWNGPESPSDEPPQPIRFLLPLEQFPSTFARRYTKWFRVTLLIIYCLLWLAVVLGILQPYFTKPPMSLAENSLPVVSLSCSGAHDFWKGKNAACGMDGKACPSFQDLGQDVIFRCPAFCDRGSWSYSLVPIGDQRIRYRGYFVGGGPVTGPATSDPQQVSSPYRGDSYLCGAGVHAGVISPFFGGCARISYASGAQASFAAADGRYGVGPSIGFDSFFPVSYFFKRLAANDNDHFSHCYDPRLFALVLNIVLGVPIVYLASGAVTFWIIAMVGYWTICLATDPPVTVDATDRDTYAHLISLGLERMLPACFILYVMWHSSVKRTFEANRQSPVTTVVLWYPLFWLGVLNNITFDRLPVDRLTWNDISHQSGALVAISSIIGVIAVCAVTQAYKIWLSGRFQKYLAIYIGMVMGLVAISLLPGLTLRIHHYILALLLIPGCSTRGHTAFMFQGILLGLFLSGAARWGLASIAETASSLRRDDPEGRVLPPTFVGYNATSGLLRWTTSIFNSTDVDAHARQPSLPSQLLQARWLSLPSQLLHARKLPPSQYTHTSLLVNDIERYVGPATEINLKSLFSSGPLADLLALSKNATVYLRLGRKVPNSRSYSDFTNAAVLHWPAGDFVPPKPGVT